MIGIVLSVYEGTMPGTLPTLFFSNVRYRTLSWTVGSVPGIVPS
jgi:MHS family proline/betaine transporter-like MFS transporter